MKTDYPELEEKEIDYIYSSGKVNRAIIVGVSYHVGISVVNKYNKKHFHICLNRKLNSRKGNFYRRYFQNCVKLLKTGTVHAQLFELAKRMAQLTQTISTPTTALSASKEERR